MRLWVLSRVVHCTRSVFIFFYSMIIVVVFIRFHFRSEC